MSEVLDALERVVQAVKRHVDNGDSPHQILHTVAGIRNQARSGSDSDLGRQAIADRQRVLATPGVHVTTSGGTVAGTTTVTVTDAPGGTVVTPAPPAERRVYSLGDVLPDGTVKTTTDTELIGGDEEPGDITEPGAADGVDTKPESKPPVRKPRPKKTT